MCQHASAPRLGQRFSGARLRNRLLAGLVLGLDALLEPHDIGNHLRHRAIELEGDRVVDLDLEQGAGKRRVLDDRDLVFGGALAATLGHPIEIGRASYWARRASKVYISWSTEIKK